MHGAASGLGHINNCVFNTTHITKWLRILICRRPTFDFIEFDRLSRLAGVSQRQMKKYYPSALSASEAQMGGMQERAVNISMSKYKWPY